MKVREITAKTLLRRRKAIDAWFVSRCGMNLYRGCVHDCAYCDGRDERYFVEGVFGEDVAVKVNAPALLDRELDPARRRKPFPPGFVMAGGGVGDSYQAAEATYGITRRCLEVLLARGRPVHLLTKSSLVLRDADLLREINGSSRALVSFSLSSADDRASALFEPCASPPSERLRALETLRRAGIPAGVFLLPVIPGITDKEEALAKSLAACAAAGADYCVFGGMTLKPGRQGEHFMAVIDAHYPDLRPGYEKVYPGNRYGSALGAYYDKLNRRFARVARDFRIPLRIPDTLFGDLLGNSDRAQVILGQLGDLFRMRGENTPYAKAARTLAALDRPLEEVIDDIDRRVGAAAGAVIREIRETGTSALYRERIFG